LQKIAAIYFSPFLRSMGILPMSTTGFSPVSSPSLLSLLSLYQEKEEATNHGQDAHGTHGQDGHATAESSAAFSWNILPSARLNLCRRFSLAKT
jgi:hypothetical protein